MMQQWCNSHIFLILCMSSILLIICQTLWMLIVLSSFGYYFGMWSFYWWILLIFPGMILCFVLLVYISLLLVSFVQLGSSNRVLPIIQDVVFIYLAFSLFYLNTRDVKQYLFALHSGNSNVPNTTGLLASLLAIILTVSSFCQSKP